jgi:hypothetical protein
VWCKDIFDLHRTRLKQRTWHANDETVSGIYYIYNTYTRIIAQFNWYHNTITFYIFFIVGHVNIILNINVPVFFYMARYVMVSRGIGRGGPWKSILFFRPKKVEKSMLQLCSV